MTRTVLTTIAGSAPLQQVQVALEQGADGRLVINLIDQHYAEGIGWYDQRSLRLEPRQWQQLQAALGGRSASLLLEAEEAPATIPFPGPRPAAMTRSAVGDGL